MNSLTLSAYANRVFRGRFMELNSIAMLSPIGYGLEHYSRISLAWMFSMKQALGLTRLRYHIRSMLTHNVQF